MSGRYDEDDEGLEFLGVEEAVRDTAPRAHSAEDDDVLTESGLNSVLDVPSWVEAIGIVIAGNLAGPAAPGQYTFRVDAMDKEKNLILAETDITGRVTGAASDSTGNFVLVGDLAIEVTKIVAVREPPAPL